MSEGATQEFLCETSDGTTYLVCIDGYGFSIYTQNDAGKWREAAQYQSSATFEKAAEFLEAIHNQSASPAG